MINNRGEKMNPKVNIVMSTYNGEKYIKEQLDSILTRNLSKYRNLCKRRWFKRWHCFDTKRI